MKAQLEQGSAMTGLRFLSTLAVAATFSLAGCGTTAGSSGGGAEGRWVYPTLGRAEPLLIGHRGASGALPEHTLEAYQRALNDGADCIEPDLVITKDNQLAVRHDTYLSTTTNVASKPEFASRKRRSTDAEYEGRMDWWVADFTMAELKTLRAVQSFPGRSKAYDGLYQIPTFEEVLQLAKSRVTAAGEPVCVYPEAKSPAYHAAIGMTDMAGAILAALGRHDMAAAGSPVFIQSFEPDFVKAIDAMTDLPVVMLVSDKAALDAAMAMPGAPFWQGLGANTGLIMDSAGKSTGVIEASHARGIPVHAWTFRDETPPRGMTIDAFLTQALSLGLDGFFTDQPITGYRVRNNVRYGVE
jgi:glycerophosphoryl diester phosphodiesterase